MPDNVVLNKVAQIERCIKRVREEFNDEFDTNFTQQDSVILNIQRACQASIDLGAYVIRKNKLGIPQSSSEVFDLLNQHKFIPEELTQNLVRMVGFRNIAIHEYDKINLQIVVAIVEKYLEDFLQFSELMIKLA